MDVLLANQMMAPSSSEDRSLRHDSSFVALTIPDRQCCSLVKDAQYLDEILSAESVQLLELGRHKWLMGPNGECKASFLVLEP